MIYGALASQVYGSVADQVYQDMANHNSSVPVEEVEPPSGPDPTTLFEAARAKFFQEGQKVLTFLLSKKCRMFFIFRFTFFYMYLPIFSIKGSSRAAGRKKDSSVRK